MVALSPPMSSDLIPVFVPSLGASLALAEKQKGRELTPEEIVELRDGGACIMMTPADAREMDLKRGYRDVDPPNCQADWRRLRTQLTGHGFLPKLVLCAPGGDALRAQTEPLLQQEGVEHEFCGPDVYLARSFEASICRLRPSLTPPDLATIGAHTTVLYTLSDHFTPQEAAAVGRRALRFGVQLLDAGAFAIKCESAGIAHAAARWRELAQRVEAGFGGDDALSDDAWAALYEAFVQLPIGDERSEYYSCGMHLLGHPDLVVSAELLKGGNRPPAYEAAHLFDIFASYLLTECGGKWFTAGHTFSVDAKAKRYRVLWERCTSYEEDDFFHNPFGRWRFVEA